MLRPLIVILILSVICIVLMSKTEKHPRLFFITGPLVTVFGLLAVVIALPTLFWLTLPLWSHKTIAEISLKENLEASEMQFILDPGNYMIAATRYVSDASVDEKGDIYYSLVIPSENIKIEDKMQADFTLGIGSNHCERFTVKHKANGSLTAKAFFPFKSKVRMQIIRNPYPP